MSMATTRTFNDMLNDFLPNEIAKEELIKRDYVQQKLERDDNWKGGARPVPFKGAGASTVKFGGLVATSDVSETKRVRGEISGYREVWSTLKFNQRDLMEHDGKIPEDTFIDLLTDELEDMMEYQKEVVSTQIGSGPHFAKATADGQAGGTITVDKIDRFQIGQKFTLDDDNSAAADCYVTAVNVNTDTITVSATRGGAALDISAYALAQNAKMYHDGVFDSGGSHDTFVSFRDALLSAANGGASTLHGQTKTAYPILQAYNKSGAAITSTNILEELFDAMTEGRQRGKGRFTTLLMDLSNYGSVMKQLNLQKSAYRVVQDEKASEFGWFEMKIANVTGQTMELVGIQEWDDDLITGVDWKSLKFLTNGYYRKRISPEGRQYFEDRATTGYSYYVDMCLFGEMEYRKAGHNLAIHSIDY